MSELKTYLIECKRAYYIGQPIISDSQYDNLEELCSEDLSVGTNKGKTKHLYRMFSLQKYYEDEFIEQNPSMYKITTKLDGAAVSLLYINGYLYSVITRGDGIYGTNIDFLITTDKARSINIPVSIKHKELVQITGEIVASKDIKNSRNYASGALNVKSVEDFEKKDITFFAYNLQYTPKQSYIGTLEYLSLLGFKTVDDISVKNYPQDGKVYRLNSNEEYTNLGYTSKHPRGAYALKKRSEGVETTLLDVQWETGKSGKVTPVAILEEVDIDGAMVSRATLNNPGFIKGLNLYIGDKVMIERAGGIIPRIIRKA